MQCLQLRHYIVIEASLQKVRVSRKAVIATSENIHRHQIEAVAALAFIT